MDSELLPFEYRLRKQTEKIGPFQLEIECLENLDQTIDALFEYLQKHGKESLLEDLCPYFGAIWPSARALAEYVVGLTSGKLAGKSVLELGCGLAIPSLVAVKLGADATATDFHPEVPRFLQRNVLNNQVQGLRYLHLNWQANELPPARYDFVIGSDLLYERQQPPLLARVIADQLAPRGTAVIADPARPYLQAFVDEMKRLGFKYDSIITRVQDQPAPKDVFLLVMQRA